MIRQVSSNPTSQQPSLLIHVNNLTSNTTTTSKRGSGSKKRNIAAAFELAPLQIDHASLLSAAPSGYKVSSPITHSPHQTSNTQKKRKVFHGLEFLAKLKEEPETEDEMSKVVAAATEQILSNQNPQVTVISSSNQDVATYNLVTLPENMLCYIWSFLYQAEVAQQIMLVCRRWLQVSRHSASLWGKLDLNAFFPPQSKAKINTMDKTVSLLNFLVVKTREAIELMPASALTNISARLQVPEYTLPQIINMSLLNSRKTEFIFADDCYESEEEDQHGVEDGISSADLDSLEALSADDCEFMTEEDILMQDEASAAASFSIPVQTLVLPKGMSDLQGSGMKQIVKLLPSVTSLSMPMEYDSSKFVGSVQQDSVVALTKFPQLKQLQLNYHDKLTDEMVEILLQQLGHQLTSLQLDYCLQLTEKTFQSISKYCGPQLQKLSLLGKIEMQSDALQEFLFNGVPKYQLQEFRISFGSYISLPLIQQFVLQCSGLQTLYLKNCQSFDSKMLQTITNGLPFLRQFSFICQTKNGNSQVVLYKPTIVSESLQHLTLQWCDSIIEPVFECPNLKQLEIENCAKLFHMDCKNTPLLKHFSLKHVQQIGLLPSFDQFIVMNMKKLQSLQVLDCKGLENVCLKQMHLLEKISFVNCSDLKQFQVQECDQLKQITIDLCSEMKNLSLDASNLETLQLFAQAPTQDPKLEVASIKSYKLVNLSFFRTKLLRQVFVECEKLDSLNLASCQRLEKLEVKNCNQLDKLAIGSVVLSYEEAKVKEWLPQNNQITMLSIANSLRMNTDQLSQMIERMPKLHALVVANCLTVGNLKIKSSSLKGIQITECNELRSFSIEAGNLSRLFIRSCPLLTDASFENLSTQCPSLKFLEVVQCNGLKTPFIRNIELSDLHFSRCSNLQIPRLECLNLKKLLFLSCDRLSWIDFREVCQEMTEILFSECPMVADNLVQEIASYLPKIQAVVFSKCNALVQPQIKFSKLKVLRFGECSNLICPLVNGIPISAINMVSFQDCKALNIARMSSVMKNLRADQIEFSNCEALKKFIFDIPCNKLVISRCAALNHLVVDAKVVAKIKVYKCQNLFSYRHYNGLVSKVDEISMQDCGELSVVEFFEDGECKLSSNCKSLKNLELNNCIRISDLLITSLLAKCSELEALNITACGISRLVVTHPLLKKLTLSKCVHLESINLLSKQTESFIIDDCPRLVLDNIQDQVPHLGELESLKMSQVSISKGFMEQVLKLFKRSSALRDVAFTNCNIL